MSEPNIIEKWKSWGPQAHGTLRIVSGFLFLCYGLMKVLAFPVGPPPNGQAVPLMSQIGVGGLIELIGGFLIMIGLFTRPSAFLSSGTMAVAYWQFHFKPGEPNGWWPHVNQGDKAILFCFVFLFLSMAGAGAWSLDNRNQPKEEA